LFRLRVSVLPQRIAFSHVRFLFVVYLVIVYVHQSVTSDSHFLPKCWLCFFFSEALFLCLLMGLHPTDPHSVSFPKSFPPFSIAAGGKNPQRSPPHVHGGSPNANVFFPVPPPFIFKVAFSLFGPVFENLTWSFSSGVNVGTFFCPEGVLDVFILRRDCIYFSLACRSHPLFPFFFFFFCRRPRSIPFHGSCSLRLFNLPRSQRLFGWPFFL